MPLYSEAVLAAIKNAVDIVALAGEHLPSITRSGSKFKALCPFHDDHKPSLELNPERQSYKCWVCGAGGDVFDFVKEIERVEFPEAVRMLAERAGVTLDAPSGAGSDQGPSKSELRAVHAWAESAFAEALGRSEPARGYAASRGISDASAVRFRLGYAPGERGWLVSKAKREGFPVDVLEQAGLVSRPVDAPGQVRERFRGRLMFPIHDPTGRPIGFGGRVLPDVERLFSSQGKHVAKYLNSPETALFQKRRVLYGWDLARAAAREEGWVAVVEGYTDVIAAHQVGLCNVVGTLGTALGDDHVTALRRLTDKVVLVFDGDDAGQNAADRALELFLGHEVDVRVLTLPESLDPCDFLLREGAHAFRALADRAVDALTFALERAAGRFELASPEGARQAAEWVLGVLARVPTNSRVGLDVKVAKALDTLSQRLRVPVSTLERRLRQIQREARPPRPYRGEVKGVSNPGSAAYTVPISGPVPGGPAAGEAVGRAPAGDAPGIVIRPSALDPTDRELVQIVLNEPASVARVISRVAVPSLRDAPLRTILQTCYDLHGEGQSATFERVALRLADPGVRALAACLLSPIDAGPRSESMAPPGPWEELLDSILLRFARRQWQERLKDLKAALDETNQADDPASHRALWTEYNRLINQRPDTKKSNAS